MNSRRQQVREFFCAPEPRLELKALSIGSGVALAGIAITFYHWPLGLLIIAIGAIGATTLPTDAMADKLECTEGTRFFSLAKYFSAKARFEARPDHKTVLKWLYKDLTKVVSEHLKIDDSEEHPQEPIWAITPLYGDEVADFSSFDVLRRKVGREYFYSTYRILAFRFTDMLIGVFQANYNMLEEITDSEEIADYFYDHVTSVKKLSKERGRSKIFSLSFTNGDTILFGIKEPLMSALAEIESLGEQTFEQVRRMVYQYRQPPRRREHHDD